MIAFRFIISLAALASGIAVLILAADPLRLSRDPALSLLIIPIVPELAYVSIESLFLILALSKIPPPRALGVLSECAVAALGLAYVRFTYRSWEVNGISTKGYVPFPWFVAATVVNMIIASARIPFPSLPPRFTIMSKILLGAVMLYAATCAVIARGKKGDIYPSTKGGFWMAFCMLAYAPFVGIADTFSIRTVLLSPDRLVSLQLFPARELFTLSLFAIHMEPLYSRIFRKSAKRPDVLSNRERQIAGCVARGMSNKEISEILNLSLATVKTHVRNVLKKTGAASRADLASTDRALVA